MKNEPTQNNNSIPAADLIAAWVGLDWADKKHSLFVRPTEERPPPLANWNRSPRRWISSSSSSTRNIPKAASPSFFHAGQGCAMTTRVLVPREAHDHLVQKMVDFVRGVVKVGDPADPSTFLGPVIRDERRRKIEEYIESGKQEGAVLAHGGGRPKDLPRGYFLEPTIFCGVPNHIRIAQEEIFGPVVAVLPFRDADEAIRVANDSTYGLGGMIFSRDTARAIELAKRIRTGAVWINNGINLIDTPFGGFKESGIGREGGRFGMEEYTELQQISWRA